FDHFPVRFRETTHYRSKNDQFTAWFDHAAEFVARFSTDPKFIVVFIKQRHDLLVFPTGVLDMNFLADLRRFAKTLTIVARKQTVSSQPVVVFARYHCCEANYVALDVIRSSLDQIPCWRFDPSDGVLNTRESPKPMRRVR